MKTVQYDGEKNPCEVSGSDPHNAFTEGISISATVLITYQSQTFCGLNPFTTNSCGKDEEGKDVCTWKYTHNDYTLHFTGTGNMERYSLNQLPEWHAKHEEIKNIDIQGITSLG